MFIDGSGNVGIGTSSPGAKFQVVGSTTVSSQPNVAAIIGAGVTSELLLGSINGNTPFIASQGAYPLTFFTNATERMRIDSSGNVGIGTSSPASTLHVSKTTSSGTYRTELRIDNQDQRTTLASYYQSGVAQRSILRSEAITAGSAIPIAFEVGSTEAMRISTNGNVGIGTSSPSADTTYKWLNIVGPTTSGGGIVQLNNSDVSVGINMFCNNLAGYVGTSTAHPLLFRINSSEVARIDSSGRVGIGTNSPNSKLQVYNPSYSAFTGSSLGGILITDTNGTNNYYSSIDFNTNSNGALPLARIAMKYTSAGSHLVFGTSNNYANGITNTAMTIDYAGNVGIGTTSPIRTLNVNGSVASSVGNVEMSLTAAATTGTAFINVSDNVGSNGSGWSLEIRGLATSGSASTNLATVSVSATNTYFNGNVNPGTTNSYDLGSSSYRWRNIYTQDLHLSNGIGDYTVVEGEEDLFLVNNKSGKTFKFALIEVDPSTIPPKSET